MAPWLAALLIAAWAGSVVLFRLNRIWLPYYILAAVGLAFLLIFVGRATVVEPALQTFVSAAVHRLSALVNVPTETFQAAPGALLVLVISQEIGWTMLQVTVESSGLLESAVLTGMLAFYPGWSPQKRLAFIAIGLTATFAANVVRLMTIVLALHYTGKDSLLIAHTIVGRAVFFAAVVAIYWLIMTRPTLRTILRKLDREILAR
ncbi:MAG: archaeosortase/exosortase family protein [Chloroflexi bacterium]|nr:archaeosortase/exosortase family protein [Chloroflexota bacterium]